MDAAPPDIFVSYAAADRERIRPLVESLERAGFNVWWDTRIAPGAGFDAEIQAALDAARCVVVFWSENSVNSEWVITEANEGLERGVLVPISIDGARPPLAFRRRQTLEIVDPKTAANDVVAAARAQIEGSPAQIPSRHRPTRPVARRHSPGLGLAYLALGLALGAGGIFWLSQLFPQGGAPSDPMRISLELDGWIVEEPVGFGTSMAMSPLGRTIAYLARSATGETVLRLRHLDRLKSVTLEGTEGAELPFFSPDGTQVGFFDGGIIKRVSINGGDPSIVATLERPIPFAANWGADEQIIFAEEGSALKTVSVRSGVVEPLTELDESRSEYSHRYPHHVVGHDVVLFSVLAGPKHEIFALNLITGERRYLLDGLSPRYVETGHMLYAKAENPTQGTIWAVPFDPVAMAVTGDARAIQGAVAGREGAAYFVGHRGPLVYLPTQGDPVAELILLDTDGTSRPIARGTSFTDPQISNSGQSIAVVRADAGIDTASLWIYDLNTGTSRRFADAGAFPVWGPNDESITFARTNVGLVVQPIDHEDSAQTLVAASGFVAPHEWINFGETLLFTVAPPGHTDVESGIYTLDPGQERQRHFNYRRSAFPSVTKDGRWIAFCTWNRGVVVGRFPNFGSATVVSETGCMPQWGPGDKQLYFQEANALWSIETSVGENVALGKRTFIADLGLQWYKRYDVVDDGRILLTRRSYSDPKPLVLFANWANELQ